MEKPNRKYISKVKSSSQVNVDRAAKQRDVPVIGESCVPDTVVLTLNARNPQNDGKKVFVCLICSATFEGKINLSSHIHTHARNGRFCPTCNRQFRSKKAFTRHMRQHAHALRSKVTKTRQNNRKRRVNVTEQGKKISQKCKVCDKKFEKCKNFERHMKLHTKLHQILLGTPEKKIVSAFHNFSLKYSCQFFMLRGWLRREKPKNVEGYRRCYRTLHFHQKKFAKRRTLRHCYVKAEPLLRCRFCSKSCRTVTSSMLHKSAHKSIQCSTCKRTFSTHFTLLVHSKRHQSRKRRENTKGKERIASKQENILDAPQNVCPTCRKSFSSRSCLNRHQRVHTGEKPYKCQQCGEEFRERIVLRKHIAKHTGIPLPKKYHCEVCKKSFALSSVLQHHMKRHGQKTLECSYCPKKFAHQKLLDRHVTTHTEEKRFACDVCGKRFLTKNNMQRHTKTHTDEKPFKCEWCGKVFRQLGNLKTHERIHTKEKPYCCEKCGRRFTQSANLKHHLLLHTGNKVFTNSNGIQREKVGLSEESVKVPTKSTLKEPKKIDTLSIWTADCDKMAVDEPDGGLLKARYSQQNTICCQDCQKSFSDPRDFPWHDCTLPQQDNLHTAIARRPVDATSFEQEDCANQSPSSVSCSSPVMEQTATFQNLENVKSANNRRMVAELAYKQHEYSLFSHQLPTPGRIVQSIPQGALTYAQHTGTFIPADISTLNNSPQPAIIIRPSSGLSLPIFDTGCPMSNHSDQFHRGILEGSGGGFFHASKP